MTPADFERIKEKIGEVYEENSDFLKKLPIDIFGLAKRMGFKIKYATDVIRKNPDKLDTYFELNSNKHVFGCGYYNLKTEQFEIYIDDIDAKENKQRFSLAHEIGHVVLGHKDNSPENEKEADYFAGYLLCPDCVGILDPLFERILSNPECLCGLFGISLDTALICADHIINRHNVIPRKNNYESIIQDCLRNSVLTKFRD